MIKIRIFRVISLFAAKTCDMTVAVAFSLKIRHWHASFRYTVFLNVAYYKPLNPNEIQKNSIEQLYAS